MGIGQIPLFAALTDKMRWHQERQSLLAENVANAETPGFRGHDLKAYDSGDGMRRLSMATVSTVPVTPNQIAISSFATGGTWTTRGLNSFEITPEGNGVTLEDEMMKVTGNQMDYQAATSLYSRSLRLIKTALGRTS